MCLMNNKGFGVVCQAVKNELNSRAEKWQVWFQLYSDDKTQNRHRGSYFRSCCAWNSWAAADMYRGEVIMWRTLCNVIVLVLVWALVLFFLSPSSQTLPLVMGRFLHHWTSSLKGAWQSAFLWSCNCSIRGCALQDESSRLLSAFMEKLKLHSYWARNHTHAGLHIRLGEIWIIHCEMQDLLDTQLISCLCGS